MTKIAMRIPKDADALLAQKDFERELEILLDAVRAGAITMRSLEARYEAHV